MSFQWLIGCTKLVNYKSYNHPGLWSVENWWHNQGNDGYGENCLLALTSGWWYDDPCSDTYHSICSVPTTTTLTSSTQVVFTSENISTTPAIQVRWVAQPSSEDGDGNQDVQNKFQSSITSAKQIPGFKIIWELYGQTKEISNVSKSKYEWMKTNRLASKKKNVYIMTIMSLLHESKIREIQESEVWKTFLKHWWDINILKTNSSCLGEKQRFEVVYKTAQDLKINYDNYWIPEEDLRLGTELFAALHYCPDNLIEAAKLSKLFESLITNENLNTVVAATMHNIQPRAGDSIKDFTAINMWYQRLDERYNFSLGPNILTLMTAEMLTHLTDLDPPFLRDHIEVLRANNTSLAFGKNLLKISFFSTSYF